MKHVGEFMRLIDALWSVWEFDMWNPKEHLSVAYVMDRLDDSDDLQRICSRWISMAQDQEFNELAWNIWNKEVELSENDDRIPPEQKKLYRESLALAERMYSQNRLTVFGIISKEYAPDWFWEVFGTYIPLREEDRRLTVIQYCEDNNFMTVAQAEKQYNKLEKHSDLLNEFCYFIRTGNFKRLDPIVATSRKISAEQLCMTTRLTPLGAYNYMISLRETPQRALEALDKGLPVK